MIKDKAISMIKDKAILGLKKEISRIEDMIGLIESIPIDTYLHFIYLTNTKGEMDVLCRVVSFNVNTLEVILLGVSRDDIYPFNHGDINVRMYYSKLKSFKIVAIEDLPLYINMANRYAPYMEALRS